VQYGYEKRERKERKNAMRNDGIIIAIIIGIVAIVALVIIACFL